MAVISEIYQLTMKFSGNQQGVSETVYLPDADRASAITSAQDVLRWRLACLSAGLTCDFARVSKWGGQRDSSVVADAFPITGGWPGSTFSVNIISDALTVRLETAEGKWANRWLHGVPDAAIHIDQLVATYAVITPVPTATPATNLTFIAAIASYLSVLKQKTVFFRHTGAGDTLVMESFPLSKVLPVHVISKKVGKPFRQQRGRATPR